MNDLSNIESRIKALEDVQGNHKGHLLDYGNGKAILRTLNPKNSYDIQYTDQNDLNNQIEALHLRNDLNLIKIKYHVRKDCDSDNEDF